MDKKEKNIFCQRKLAILKKGKVKIFKSGWRKKMVAYSVTPPPPLPPLFTREGLRFLKSHKKGGIKISL